MKPHSIIHNNLLGDSVLPISAHRDHTFTKGHCKSPYKLETMAASWALQIPWV